MAKEVFHNTGFDKGTKSKLEIFKEYFKESLPVFVHSKYFTSHLVTYKTLSNFWICNLVNVILNQQQVHLYEK